MTTEWVYGAICAAKILHRRREFQLARERDTSEITDLPNPLPPRRAIN